MSTVLLLQINICNNFVIINADCLVLLHRYETKSKGVESERVLSASLFNSTNRSFSLQPLEIVLSLHILLLR